MGISLAVHKFQAQTVVRMYLSENFLPSAATCVTVQFLVDLVSSRHVVHLGKSSGLKYAKGVNTFTFEVRSYNVFTSLDIYIIIGLCAPGHDAARGSTKVTLCRPTVFGSIRVRISLRFLKIVCHVQPISL